MISAHLHVPSFPLPKVPPFLDLALGVDRASLSHFLSPGSGSCLAHQSPWAGRLSGWGSERRPEGAKGGGLGRIRYRPLSGAGTARQPLSMSELLLPVTQSNFSAFFPLSASLCPPHSHHLLPPTSPASPRSCSHRPGWPWSKGTSSRPPFSAQGFRGNLEHAASWGLSFAALKKQQVSRCVLCRPKYNLTVLARPPCLREKAAWLVT